MRPFPRWCRRVTRPAVPVISILLLIAFLPVDSWTRPAEYADLKADAERSYAEGSYGRAHEIYLKASSLAPSPGERRWVSFRLADTLWRSRAATATADTTELALARKRLEDIVGEADRPEKRDRVFAEAEESLGDFFWTRRDARDFGRGWPRYQGALDWWAGSSDIETARARYLAIVFRIAEPAWRDPWYVYGHAGNLLPVEVVENALLVAGAADEKAHAHYLLAMSLRSFGGGDDPSRIADEFEAALAHGKGTDWYDDALFHYGAWMEAGGGVVVDEDGNRRQEPDFVKALELYRRLLREFAKGETRYYDDARRRIEEITRPVVEPAVGNVFLPGSEVRFHLAWRNVGAVALSLHRVDLTADLDLPGPGPGRWLEGVDLARAAKVRSWSHDTKDKGDHRPGRDTIRLDGPLPPGAYLLLAEGGGRVRRDLVLVTDAALVLKVSPSRVLAYFCDAADGSAIPGATVTLWRWGYEGGKAIGSSASLRTDGDGIALFPLPKGETHFLAAAAAGDRQAFSPGSSRLFRDADAVHWRVYAFTDRPAYRPGEEVHWKAVVREAGPAGYATPSGKTLKYVVSDPRGAKVKEGSLRLNAFGSAWDSLPLSDAMPLGEYRVAFEGPVPSGAAALFRLEEYKLPEFEVTVRPPAEGGRPRSLRPGEAATVEIGAEYYSGGPVAGAEVEAVVYRRPFTPLWRPPAEFPWLEAAEEGSSRDRHGPGEVVRREKLRTDGAGKAAITLAAPREGRQDFEFTVEARVTDASRREVAGRGAIRVTRQRYYVHAHPEHRVYRPRDRVTVAFRALDGNERPVAAQGTVKVVRSRYVETWVDPRGREVSGMELEAAMGKGRVLPPPPGPGGIPWRPKFRGYVDEEVATQTVKTDGEGNGALSFTPGLEGYYRLRWSSETGDRFPVRAETAVHVASEASTDIGYRHGGLEILVDRDAVRAGLPLAVMLVAPASGRPVLFSVEGEDLESHRLLRLDGQVKLLALPVEERHVPNFVLAAVTVSDLQMYRAEKEILVPPVKNVLDVRVEMDGEAYRPGGEGTVTVTVRDDAGKPVVAEIGLALADEAVHAIQEDYAGDPRPFFFGTKRGHGVRTQSSLDPKRYVRLVRTEEGRLVDERDLLLARIGAGAVPPGEGGADQEAKRRAAVAGRRAPAGVLGDAAREEASEAKAMMAADRPSAPAPPGRLSGAEPAVAVRADFRATALWRPDLVTGPDGKATAKVAFPQALTSWRATARAATGGARVGIARAAAKTDMPLMVRLQAPRFFVVGDTATVSAVISNNTDKEMTVTPSLEAEGVAVDGALAGGRPARGGPKPLLLAAGATGRADWAVSVKAPGTARLTATAKGGGHADAMKKELPVHQHGVEKFVAASGKVRGDEAVFVIDLPKERRPGSTSFVVLATPSLAATMLDALPYLAEYPYGCTEQTMSRFLPAVVTAKTLKDLGLPPEAVQDRLFGGIEAKHAEKTHPERKKDLRMLDDMIAKGLARLYDFQHADGGWGWWKEGESDHFMSAYVLWGLSLARAAGVEVRADLMRRAATFLEKEIVEEEEQLDMQAWMLHALAVYGAEGRREGSRAARAAAAPGHPGPAAPPPGKEAAKALANLWKSRDRLNAHTRALLALSAHSFGEAEKAAVLVRNLENGVTRDDDPGASPLPGKAPEPGGRSPHPGSRDTGSSVAGGTAMAAAHWGADGIAWRWSDGAVEATAAALRALLAVDPANPLVEPVTAWLIRNRRGAQWSNTRDTAMAVLALNDYLRASGETASEVEYEVAANGRRIAGKTVRPGEALAAPAAFAVDGKDLRDGRNEIRVRKVGGSGPLYVSVRADFFSLEEPVTPAGHELFVRREYARLAGRPTLLKGIGFEGVPLADGGTATSGERVEVTVTVEGKNDLEYLVLEDLKPAGLEAVEATSGGALVARELTKEAVKRRFGGGGPGRGAEGTERGQKQAGRADAASRPVGAAIRPVPPPREESDYTGRTRRVYRELRDRKAALFIDKLPEGVWEIRYEMRAEIPGRFHALPLLGHAMYVPEIRGNGAEARITVAERP